jgi:hypothetical protein
MAPLELVGARHQRGRTRTSSLSSAVADLSHSSERLWPPQRVDFDDFVKRWRASLLSGLLSLHQLEVSEA